MRAASLSPISLSSLPRPLMRSMVVPSIESIRANSQASPINTAWLGDKSKRRAKRGLQEKSRQRAWTVYAGGEGDRSSLDKVKERLRGGRLGILVTWMVFALYALGFAPGGSPESAANDQQILQALFTNPFDLSVNPVFVFIFNSLGVIPMVYASLLLPGATDQKPLRAGPFVGASFALGFFALGPYLATREERADPKQLTELSGPAGFLEKKIFSGLVLGVAIGLSVFLAQSLINSDISALLSGYLDLFKSQRFVHVSSLDFMVLSVLIYGPILEDMKRRGVGDETKALLYSALPVLGPSIYLLTRPGLSATSEKDTVEINTSEKDTLEKSRK
ncbi:hypothetical protein AAMO2058_000225500 [Amorphochlora amoebiformis]|mmetsp:Transcript_33255/g.53413  ORF Transcript_33255/g.53413 Transcript_33255/m.53413 type:complete len:334 (-) Transcript_33255:163-1164(-)